MAEKKLMPWDKDYGKPQVKKGDEPKKKKKAAKPDKAQLTDERDIAHLRDTD